MIALALDADTEKRLEALAARTGRDKAFHVREAILTYLDDLEDFFVAEKRVIDTNTQGAIPLAELKSDLGFGD